MKKEINFGIGFITGRPNICHIINNYYKYLVDQVADSDYKVNFTVFILFDLTYQFTTRIDFYGILPEVYKNMDIKYITPEEIDEEKKILMSKYGLTKGEADLFIGKGYAKARNMILYTALRKKMDYLLFWDDDEYPLANIKDEGDSEINWQNQQTIKHHILNIQNSDITCGDRCGIMNPVPYIEYNETLQEEEYKAFIEGIFEINNQEFIDACKDLHIDVEDEVVISKEIYSNGKSNIKINYRNASLSALKLIMPYLVDVHSQFETQSLFSLKKHIGIY